MRTLIADGLAFPEGPTFDPEGNLYVVNLQSGIITRIGRYGEVSAWVDTRGRPNGAAWNLRDNTLTVCDAGLKQLLTITHEGAITTLAAEFNGEPLAGPNDCAYDPEGNLYFTDPLGSSLERPIGKVYCLLASGDLRLFDDGYAFSNGLAFGPRGDLFVAESRTRRVYRYVLGTPGSYTAKSLFVELSGGRGPDGMAFDAEGNLYIAHAGKGCIAVVNAAGEIVDELDAGGQIPTNVAFGGPDNADLFITEAETGSVYKMPVGKSGLRLY